MKIYIISFYYRDGTKELARQLMNDSACITEYLVRNIQQKDYFDCRRINFICKEGEIKNRISKLDKILEMDVPFDNDYFNLLCLEYGVGGSTWYERYYDIEKEKVSRFFEMPYLGYNNLVAYFSLTDNDVCLFVEDVFDSNIRYEVKRGFPRSVLREKVKLRFVEMNKIHVEYNDENGDKISEVIGF